MADLNGDGKVNLADRDRFSVPWDVLGEPIAGDLNRDGRVELGDVPILARYWLYQ